MSFEEHPDSQRAQRQRKNEAGEFPPALATLAEQLSNEAAALARCYPARQADTIAAFAAAIAVPARLRWKIGRRLAVASGFFAASVLVVLLGWQAADRLGRKRAIERGPLPVVQTNQVARLNGAGDMGHPAADTNGGEQNFLRGLSGAEQEAVLDLMEAHTAQRASLSI